jgi:Helix-loop-helix DNA-binding domain
MMLMNDCLLVSSEVSPTPVLLSSPFATASSFLAQNQSLQLLPVSESHTIHSGPGRRRSNASSSSDPIERKKPFKRSSPYSRSSKEERREVRELSPRSSGRNKKAPHELLTEAEKKANHIASEQKRRQNIRVGFDQLVDIVPTLSQNHRSEAMILQKCTKKKSQWGEGGVPK